VFCGPFLRQVAAVGAFASLVREDWIGFCVRNEFVPTCPKRHLEAIAVFELDQLPRDIRKFRTKRVQVALGDLRIAAANVRVAEPLHIVIGFPIAVCSVRVTSGRGRVCEPGGRHHTR